MNRQIFNALIVAAFAVVGSCCIAPTAQATDGFICSDCFCSTCVCGDCECLGCCDCGYMLPAYRARCYNWNGNYAHSAYGAPVALVIPPTANMQTNWGWGVSSSRVSHMDQQVRRNYPGPGPYGGPWRRTPAWPSDTTQFGVYYVRGPW